MQCERAQEFFSDYVEQSLDRPLAGALESHLRVCPDCRAGLQALQETYDALDCLPEVEPPADGAWRVIAAVRHLRAEEFERGRHAERPTFWEWVQSLNPFRVAVGASLATLIVGGLLVVAGNPHTQLTLGFPLPSREQAPRVGTRAALMISYGPRTEIHQQVDLQLQVPRTMTDAVVQIEGERLPLAPTLEGTLRGGEWTPLARLQLLNPSQPDAVLLTVQASSGRTGQSHRMLVVVPVGQRRPGRVELVLASRPLPEAVQSLAPYLGRPVVMDSSVQGFASLRADGEPPLRCLEALAQQVGAQVVEEHGAYRLVPLR